MAPTKKKKLQLNFDHSPSKRQKKVFGNLIDVHLTKVPHLSVVLVFRGDKPAECPYLKPIVDAFEEDATNAYASEWSVMKIAPRKGNANGKGGYDVLLKASGSEIAFDCFILYRLSESSSWIELGKNFASKLNAFVEGSNDYDTKVPFIFRTLVADSPKALSHHLLDKDVACLLKRSYSASKKEEVADDESVLECFFESAKNGKQALDCISKPEWETM